MQAPRGSVVGRGDLSLADEYVSGGHVVSPCLACFDKGYNVGGAVWCQQEMSYYVGECRMSGDIEPRPQNRELTEMQRDFVAAKLNGEIGRAACRERVCKYE